MARCRWTAAKVYVAWVIPLVVDRHATTGRVDKGVCAERQVVVAQALAMIAVARAFR